MVACSICKEEIPKPKRCAHGKKPTKCTEECQRAYVGEHEAECQAKRDAVGEGEAENLETTSGDQDAAGAIAHSAGGGAEADVYAAEADVYAAAANVHAAEPDVHAAEPDVQVAEPDVHAAEPDTNTAEPDINAAEPDINAAEPDTNAAEADSNTAEAGGVSDFDFDLVRQVRNCQMVTCRNCYRTYEELGIEKILKCGRCLLVGYCGRDCQRVHWENQHKRECRLMKELAETAMSNENVEAASA